MIFKLFILKIFCWKWLINSKIWEEMLIIGKDCWVRDNDFFKIFIECIMIFLLFGICKFFVDLNNILIVDKVLCDIFCVFFFIDLIILVIGIFLDLKKDLIFFSFLVVVFIYYKINKFYICIILKFYFV